MEPSDLNARYNLNSPAVKRILKELRELKKTKSSLFVAEPLEDNIFEWHFTMRGPKNTEFEGGVYHGKIILPSEYPLKPPDIIFLTPNGRFEVGKKICLTISSHHAESWRPSWSVRTVILAIIGFFPTRGDGAIASLDWPKQERIELALASLAWKCPRCGSYNITALPAEDENESLEQYGELTQIKIKNKEEQEKDEAEKKRLEELKAANSQTSQLPTTTTTTTSTPEEQSPSHQLKPPPSETEPPPQQQQTLQPQQDDGIVNVSGVRRRPPLSINAGQFGSSVAQGQGLPQEPAVGGVIIRSLDIFIVIVLFALVGLIMKKFAL